MRRDALIQLPNGAQAAKHQFLPTDSADEPEMKIVTENNEAIENRLSTQIKELDSRLADFIIRETKVKFWKDAVIPILSLMVALAGIFTSMIVQFVSIRSQTDLKQYEVTFIAKQKAYSDFMATAHNLFFSSTEYVKDDIFFNMNKFQAQAFAIQPFLAKKEQDKLWQDVQAIIQISIDRFKQHRVGEKDLDQSTNAFLARRDNLRQWLSVSLFPNTK